MTGSHLCPRCCGLDPWIRGQVGPQAIGCMYCDFRGTREAYDRQNDQWKKDMEDSDRAHAEYIRNGVCSGCGAKCPKEASEMCKPRSLADTGDYWCEGEDLWQDEIENEDEEASHEPR